MDDIIQYVLAPTRKGQSLTDAERKAEITLVKTLIDAAAVVSKEKTSSLFGVADYPMAWLDNQLFRINGYVPERYNAENGEIMGFGYQERVQYEGEDNSALYYGTLLKVKQILESARNTGNQATRDHYGYLLHKIENALKIK